MITTLNDILSATLEDIGAGNILCVIKMYWEAGLINNILCLGAHSWAQNVPASTIRFNQ